LIEAAQYLRDETAKIDDETNPLKKQLQRFDVTWVLLSPQAAELQALQRWAKITCHPGEAATRAEETRQSYRATRSSYESMEQDGSVDETDDLDETDDNADVAA
jgi:hypothetical protein